MNAYVEMIEQSPLFQDIDPDYECELRNEYLSKKYNKIPSYALWRPNDIHKMTRKERRKWWKSLPEYKEYKKQQIPSEDLYKKALVCDLTTDTLTEEGDFYFRNSSLNKNTHFHHHIVVHYWLSQKENKSVLQWIPSTKKWQVQHSNKMKHYDSLQHFIDKNSGILRNNKMV